MLLSTSAPDGTTRYVDQLVDGVPNTVRFRYFRWRTALFGRYDVLHVHWPELIVRAKSPRKAWLRRRAVDLLALRMRSTRTPLVRTVHNETPHEVGSSGEARSLAVLDRLTTTAIVLNPATNPPAGAHKTYIPHGHYRDRFLPPAGVDATPGRLLFFGLVRPYKGVEQLLDAFVGSERTDLELRVVGRATAERREMLARRIDAAPRVTARFEFVPDEDLVAEVVAAEIVVLPYKDMHNSGAALVALSLDRPVVVPATSATTWLAEEVGPGWVFTYRGDLSSSTLGAAVDHVRAADRPTPPRLGGRDWASVGAAHAKAYGDAIDRVRGRG